MLMQLMATTPNDHDLRQLHLIGATEQSIQMCQEKALKNMEHVSRKSYKDH